MKQTYYDPAMDIDPKHYLATVCNLNPTDIEYSCEAFDFILNAFPNIRVTEDRGIVTVGGFWAKNLNTAVHKEWGSLRVNNSIFIELSMRKIVFHSFFAVEILYILNTLKQSKQRQVNDDVLNDLINTIYNETWLRKASESEPLTYNLKELKRLNTTLLPSQLDFIDNYAIKVPKLNLKGMLLHGKPGTGKTIAGFGFSLAFEFDLTIFIVPKNSVKEVWQATIETRFKKVPKYWVSTNPKPPTGKEEYIICHYESLGRVLKALNQLKAKKVCVWLDESHNMNTEDSGRTKKFLDLVDVTNASACIWASGTPLKAIGKEAVPLLTSIDPLFSESVRKAFIGIYGATKGRALDILNHRLGKLTFKIEKSTVMNLEMEEYAFPIDMPTAEQYTLSNMRLEIKEFVADRVYFHKSERENVEKSVQRLLAYVEIEKGLGKNPQYKQYVQYIRLMHKRFDPFNHKELMPICKEFEKEFIYPLLKGEDLKEFKQNISRYKYVSLVIRGEALGFLGQRRIDCLTEMANSANFTPVIEQAEKKTIIFTPFVSVADALKDKVTKEGYHPLVVYGETNKDLTAIMKTFKDDPKANPIIATYASLSTAVPVIEANLAIMFPTPWRSYIDEQSIARIARLGQDSKVHVVRAGLNTEGAKNLIDRQLDVMKWSKEMVDLMMGEDLGEVELSAEGLSEPFVKEVFLSPTWEL